MSDLQDDPKLLGEVLAMGAHANFGRGGAERFYECRGQKLRFTQTRQNAKLTALDDDGEKNIFTLEHTGDGLTYSFGTLERHGPVSLTVLTAARDYVHDWVARQ